MKLTNKQVQIMQTVMKGERNEEGHPVGWFDVDQLLEALPYRTTKDSFQFSMRALTAKGILETKKETRRGRKRTVLAPTPEAYRFVPEAVNTRPEVSNGIVEFS